MAVIVTSEDVTAIALAIANANRHPDPAWWASRVAASFMGEEMPESASVPPQEEAAQADGEEATPAES